MKARMFCPTHGKLSFDQVIIRRGVPVCAKCHAKLEFGTVRPRNLSVKKKKR